MLDPHACPAIGGGSQAFERGAVYEFRDICRRTPAGVDPGAALLIPAVNEMFEIAGTKAIAAQTHLPGLVLAFLAAAGPVSGLVAGFGMARGHRNWLSVIACASVVAVAFYVMIDMEDPRGGAIRIGAADLALANLRDSMERVRD